jgi:hypothetical protein
MQTRLHLNYLRCEEQTELGHDEIYIIVAARSSDGNVTRLRFPQSGTAEFGTDPHNNTIGGFPLWDGNLQDGQSVEIVVVVMEEDGGDPSLWLNIAGGILESTGNPYAIAAGAITDILATIFTADTDDYIGSIGVRYSNNSGALHEEYRGIDRTSPLPIDAIQLNGDGSRYIISARGIAG